jgi:hypothetical protein
MRIMVIILSSFAGLVLVLHVALPLRLNELIGSGAWAPEAIVWVAVVGAWAMATALVAPAPSLAVWLFASAGVLGLFVGARTDDRQLILWSAVANVLAVLATLARQEKRAADRVEWHREQRDIAVHLALRSLQETVPDLLAHVPSASHDAFVPAQPSLLHPIVPASRPTDPQAPRR